MKKRTSYSSVPLIVATSAAIVLSFVVGWLLMVPSAGIETDVEAQPSVTSLQPPLAVGDDATADAVAVVDPRPLDIMPPLAPPAEEEPDDIESEPAIDIEVELRKARFAADADLLVSPPEGNALYYYSRVVAAAPDHLQASSEFDAVLARVALDVSEHLSANEIDEAYELTLYVAAAKPDHSLVEAMRATLSERSNRLVDRALSLTRSGDDDGAANVLATLQSLPGVDADVVAATVAYTDELRQTRINEEAQLAEVERAANELAVNDWTEKVRGAIKSGQLVSPDGNSARDFLAERDGPKESKDALTDELLSALLEAGQQSVDEGDLETGERLLAAAADLREDADGLTELRALLERRIIGKEESRILELSDFVRLNTPPVRYPHIATRLELNGWVEVLFTVTANGSTDNIEVVSAEPANIFDAAAVKAVEQWTFQPREYRGQRLNQRTRARVVFELN